MKKKAKNLNLQSESRDSLDEIYMELSKLSRKMNGLGSLFMCSSTDVVSELDYDDDWLMGLGELLKDYSEEIQSLASQVSEHAVKSA